MSKNSWELSRRNRKKLASLISALLIVIFSLYANKNPQLFDSGFGPLPSGTYRVLSIEDGDTITVDMNGTEERIRFIGVDTPETKDPRKPVQCFGYAASNFTKSLIGNGPVRLEADPLSTNRDRYNRLLRYVYLTDGTLVQAEIIKQGYGFAYTSFPFTKSDEFKQYQVEAQDNNRGLWSDCQPETNNYGGYTSNPDD